MAQLAVAVAGAFIGSFAGPLGAQIGFAAGSIIGGALFQEGVKGPRLEDLKSNQYDYGTPVTHLYGTARVPGVVAWSSEKQEVSTTTGGGKGGPEVTSYTYKQDVLYMLSANECAGVRRIWSNGKLVWSAADDATFATLQASADTDAWEEIEFFTGAEDQLPWSVYEAAVGVGNAPAMRGRFTVGITGLNLGSSGFPPNLTFELVHNGSPGDALTHLYADIDDEGDDQSAYELSKSVTSDVTFTGGKIRVSPPGGGELKGITWSGPSLVRTSGTAWTLECYLTVLEHTNGTSNKLFSYYPDGSTEITVASGYTDARVGFDDGSTLGPDFDPVSGPSIINTRTHIAMVQSLTQFRLYVAGNLIYSNTQAPTPANTSGFVRMGTASVGGFFGLTVVDYEAIKLTHAEVYTGSSFTPPATIPGPDGNTISSVADPLDEVLEDLCVRSGLDLSYVDASACSGLVVDSMAVSQVTPARQVIETLMTAKNVTVVEGDTLKFVLRGGSSVGSPGYDELGATEGDPEGERLPITIRSDIEIPAQVAVTYANLLADYQNGTEYSDRLIGGARGVQTVQLPMGLNPQEAKRVADVRLHDAALAATSIGPVGLTVEWSKLEPTDILTLTDQSGSTFRTRIEKITDGGGVRTLEVVLDDASILTSEALTDVTDNSSTVVRAVEDTTLVLMDIPILRDVDNDSDHYAAVSPRTSEGTWPGAALYRDTENLMTITDRTVIGTCTTTLGDFAGGFVFDEQNTLTVSVNGALESYTRAGILAGTAAAYLVGSEIIYARTATLVSPGVYTLSGLLRGRRGTDWAIGLHEAGETIVRLQSRGLRRVDMSVSQLGVEYPYKAVTIGKAVASATEQDFTNTGIGLKPFSPVNARASRASTGDINIEFSRRTRLACGFTGSNGITVPLGEVSEAYEVDVYSDGTFTTVVRTIEATSEVATYSAADQNDDFGDIQEQVFVRIYQVSSIVGRGYPLEATLNAGPANPSPVVIYAGSGAARSVTSYIDTRNGGAFIAKQLSSIYTPNALVVHTGGVTIEANTSSTGLFTGSGATLDAIGINLTASSSLNYNPGNYIGVFLPKRAGLFEVLTWNGDGTGARDISHSLGYAPAMALVRRTDDDSDWLMYSSQAGADMSLTFPTTTGAAFISDTASFPDVSTASALKIGSALNASGESWMALLFSGDSPLSSEGTYAGNGSSSGPSVSVGFRPKLLIIRSLGATNRLTYIKPDGIDSTAYSHWTFDDTGRVAGTADFVTLSGTGFTVSTTDGTVNENGVSYQYIALADWS